MPVLIFLVSTNLYYFSDQAGYQLIQGSLLVLLFGVIALRFSPALGVLASKIANARKIIPHFDA